MKVDWHVKHYDASDEEQLYLLKVIFQMVPDFWWFNLRFFDFTMM